VFSNKLTIIFNLTNIYKGNNDEHVWGRIKYVTSMNLTIVWYNIERGNEWYKIIK
jgi:hypothetical protein